MFEAISQSSSRWKSNNESTGAFLIPLLYTHELLSFKDFDIKE